jgi:hypothetical protein
MTELDRAASGPLDPFGEESIEESIPHLYIVLR